MEFQRQLSEQNQHWETPEKSILEKENYWKDLGEICVKSSRTSNEIIWSILSGIAGKIMVEFLYIFGGIFWGLGDYVD